MLTCDPQLAYPGLDYTDTPASLGPGCTLTRLIHDTVHMLPEQHLTALKV